jgi:hypothetical protein
MIAKLWNQPYPNELVKKSGIYAAQWSIIQS